MSGFLIVAGVWLAGFFILFGVGVYRRSSPDDETVVALLFLWPIALGMTAVEKFALWLRRRVGE